MFMSFAAAVDSVGIAKVGGGGGGVAVVILEPQKVSIFRAHPFQWPSKWICPRWEAPPPSQFIYKQHKIVSGTYNILNHRYQPGFSHFLDK
jgi:hypothetical protein